MRTVRRLFLLTERLVHMLVERHALTNAEAIEVVQTAEEVKDRSPAPPASPKSA